MGAIMLSPTLINVQFSQLLSGAYNHELRLIIIQA